MQISLEFEFLHFFLYRSGPLAGPDGLITRGITFTVDQSEAMLHNRLVAENIPGVFMVDIIAADCPPRS